MHPNSLKNLELNRTGGPTRWTDANTMMVKIGAELRFTTRNMAELLGFSKTQINKKAKLAHIRFAGRRSARFSKAEAAQKIIARAKELGLT